MSAASPLPAPGRQAPTTRTASARSPRRSMLSLVPKPMQARRAPFVALLLVLLSAGLVALLLLNTGSAQDAFKLHTLQDTDASLQQEIQSYASVGDGLGNPATLAARAAALGMVAGNSPVFLKRGAPIPTGAIRVGDEAYIPGPVVVPPKPLTAAQVRAAAQAAAAARAKAATAAAKFEAAVTANEKAAAARATAAAKAKAAVEPKTAVVPKTAVKPKAAVAPKSTATAPATRTPTTSAPATGTVHAPTTATAGGK